jgi:hypothetical protein
MRIIESLRIDSNDGSPRSIAHVTNGENASTSRDAGALPDRDLRVDIGLRGFESSQLKVLS